MAKKRIRYIKVISHGVAYYKTKYKGRSYLSGKPLLRNNTISKGDDSFDIEQAPRSYKKTHQAAAKKLGISVSDLKNQRIGYY